jgi:2-polyprenyl-3-methyl-5-hydroxy-6-metoxy-1,4-benzoquinol methylase
MTVRTTRDPVNQSLVDVADGHGIERFGLMNNQVWQEDPKRLVFTLARYKFVAKMLNGLRDAAEIGCGDGFGARIVKQSVANLLITDFDPLFIEDIEKRRHPNWPITAKVHDILAGPLDRTYDAVYSLDVLEHIEPVDEARFLRHVAQSLRPFGLAIIGMPSVESQSYASPASKAGHVNCKTGKDLHKSLLEYFNVVLMFSMNDEVVHTGFMPMAHYLIGICIGPKIANAR